MRQSVGVFSLFFRKRRKQEGWPDLSLQLCSDLKCMRKHGTCRCSFTDYLFIKCRLHARRCGRINKRRQALLGVLSVREVMAQQARRKRNEEKGRFRRRPQRDRGLLQGLQGIPWASLPPPLASPGFTSDDRPPGCLCNRNTQGLPTSHTHEAPRSILYFCQECQKGDLGGACHFRRENHVCLRGWLFVWVAVNIQGRQEQSRTSSQGKKRIETP